MIIKVASVLFLMLSSFLSSKHSFNLLFEKENSVAKHLKFIKKSDICIWIFFYKYKNIVIYETNTLRFDYLGFLFAYIKILAESLCLAIQNAIFDWYLTLPIITLWIFSSNLIHIQLFILIPASLILKKNLS